MDSDEKPPVPERSRRRSEALLDHWSSNTPGAPRPSPGNASTYSTPLYSSIGSTITNHTRRVSNPTEALRQARGVSQSSFVSLGSINRKPVQRRSISDNTPQATSHKRDASHNAPEVVPHSGFGAAALQSTLPERPRLDTSTDMLLTEASRSLGSLTEGLSPVTVNEEFPPPYAHERAAPAVTDEKRQEVSNGGALPTDLIQIIRENRLDLLQQLLARGVNIDEADISTRRTAIMEAAGLHRLNAARILLDAGCRLHLKDPNGNSALHYAAVQGDSDMCAMLLASDAQIDEYNNLGETPLQLAARGGHTEAVHCLLNSLTFPTTPSTTPSLSLLNGFLEATKSGNVSTAEAFVERGITPKKVKEPWRPVAYAAQSGSIPMVDFLLLHKVNLKERSPEGWTALHFASALGHTSMVERLLAWKLSWKAQTKKSQETALHLAILGRHTATAMALILHKDARLAIEDADGMQAIHHATRNGDTGLVTTLLNRGLLLGKGPKLDERNKYGWTPMLLACAYGHLPLVAEFMTRGVNIEDRLEYPAFKPSRKTNAAARKGYWAEIRWPHSGCKALHLALEFSHDEVANTLIAAGAKIEESDAAGWKPLHYAVFSGRLRVVELLLGRGASPHVSTYDGNTPLSLGFREHGVSAPYEDKAAVYEFLQAATYASKKSKMRQFTTFLNAAGANKGREVGDRNKIWHLAGLADSLCQSDLLLEVPEDEGEDDGAEPLTPLSSVQPSINDDLETNFSPTTLTRQSTTRLMKSWTD